MKSFALLAVFVLGALSVTAMDHVGEGGPDPLLTAIRNSASEGNADAQCLLADLYAAGDGLAKDLAEAAKLYRMAAEQGHDMAQLKLACCYRDGSGVPRNRSSAYIWFNISALNGAELNGRGRAGELVDKIRMTLPPGELDKAEASIKRFQREISVREKENYSRIINQLNRAGWRVTMRKGRDGSHNVYARKAGKTSVSHGPNWRVAFISVLQQCEKWPGQDDS